LNKKKSPVLLAGLALVSSEALALDGVAVDAGYGHAIDAYRVGIAAQGNWGKRWFQREKWHVGGYWDLAVARWRWRNAQPGQIDTLYEISLIPVFRLQPAGLEGVYVEAGIGVHLLSQTSFGDRGFSTTFQFGNLAGAGYRFGRRDALELGYRYDHISNADIKKPNRGMNFHQLRLRYHF